GFNDQISPNSALANKPMFGPSGFLNLRTSQVLVVFRPSTTLSADKQTISQITNAFSQHSSASFSVGGMFWHAGASAAQGQQNYHPTPQMSNDGTPVTIADNPNAPKVLGITPATLQPGGSSCPPLRQADIRGGPSPRMSDAW